MIVCNCCGANMRFDPKKQKLVCDFCGNEIAKIDENEENRHVITADEEKIEFINEEKIEDNKKDNKYFEVKFYKCPQCGGKIYTTNETVATFCNYCGSSVLIEERAKRERPDCLIPFEITKDECLKIYKNKIKKAWFAPNNMKSNVTIEKFRGIYMPYWIFNFSSKEPIEFKGTKSYVSEKYKYIQEYKLTAYVDLHYFGIPFDSSKKFYDSISQEISMFDESKIKEFDPLYLSGFYVDATDVNTNKYKKYNEKAQELVTKNIKENLESLAKKEGYDSQINSLDSYVRKKFKDKAKIAYMPVWFLAVKNGDANNVSYAAVNGYTGDIVIELPIDKGKFFRAILLTCIPVFFVINFLPLIPAEALSICSIIFNAIGLVFLIEFLDLLYNEEFKKKFNYETIKYTVGNKIASRVIEAILLLLFISLPLELLFNKGTFSIHIIIKYLAIFLFILLLESIDEFWIKKVKREAIQKMPWKSKITKIVPSILGIILGVLAIFLQVPNDEFYYIIALISFCLFIYSIIQIIDTINKFTFYKFPQFEKRGGDVE